MEFIKIGKNYMIKFSNGRIVTEEEKLELENQELIIKDIQSNECQGKTTQKITKNKKRIKQLMEEEKKFIPVETYDAAPSKMEEADDTIKETDKTI